MEIPKFEHSRSQIALHEGLTTLAEAGHLEDLEGLDSMLQTEMKTSETGLAMESDFDVQGVQYSFKRDLHDGVCRLGIDDGQGGEQFVFTPLEFEGKDYGADQSRPVRIAWEPSVELLDNPDMALEGDIFSPDAQAMADNSLFLETRLRSFMDRFVMAAKQHTGQFES